MTQLFGLDIGRFAVKGALFEKKFRSREPLRLIRRIVNPSDDEERFTAAARTARVLLAESGYDEDEDALAVVYPSHLLNWRPMTSPFRDRRKINETLPFEIETQTPFGADDIVTGYQVMAEGEGGSSLLVCVTPKKSFEKFLAVLRESGVIPDMVVAAPFMTEGAEGYGWRSGLSINVGSDGIRMAVIQPEGTRCHYAENRLTDGEDDDTLVAVVTQEVRRVSSGMEAPLHGALWVTGGGGSSAFATTLATTLALPLDDHRSFATLRIDDDRSVLRSADRALFDDAVAAALALAPEKEAVYCNLLTKKYVRKRKFAGSGVEALFTGALLALFLLVGLVTYVAEGFSLQSRLDEVKGELRGEFRRALPGRNKIISVIPQLKAALGELQARQSVMGAADADPVLNRLLDITGAIARGGSVAEVTELTYERSTIVLKGEAASFEEVESIRKGLVTLPWVAHVAAPETKTAVTPGRVDFRIEVTGK